MKIDTHKARKKLIIYANSLLFHTFYILLAVA